MFPLMTCGLPVTPVDIKPSDKEDTISSIRTEDVCFSHCCITSAYLSAWHVGDTQ